MVELQQRSQNLVYRFLKHTLEAQPDLNSCDHKRERLQANLGRVTATEDSSEKGDSHIPELFTMMFYDLRFCFPVGSHVSLFPFSTIPKDHVV